MSLHTPDLSIFTYVILTEGYFCGWNLSLGSINLKIYCCVNLSLSLWYNKNGTDFIATMVQNLLDLFPMALRIIIYKTQTYRMPIWRLYIDCRKWWIRQFISWSGNKLHSRTWWTRLTMLDHHLDQITQVCVQFFIWFKRDEEFFFLSVTNKMQRYTVLYTIVNTRKFYTLVIYCII